MKPLDGIRVLDATRIVSGPVCCWMLASLGAEVIRVDPPDGDTTWRTPPFVGPGGIHRGERRPGDIGISALRRSRGKRSVVLDLKNASGLDVFRRLVRVCDVLVENFVPGTAEKLGIGYAALSRLNPRLVYCSISGYGQDGPYRDRSAMDLVVQAVSGLMAKTGFPDGPPTKVGATVGDQVPALYAALGIMAALRQRELDGRGQQVDVAMLDALLALLWDEPIDDFVVQGLPVRVGNGDPRGGPLGVYQTADGWAAMVVTSNAQWQRLTVLLERPDLAERYETISDRARDIDHLNEQVADWCRTRATDEVVASLHSAGIPTGPVQAPAAMRGDPHVAHRGSLVPLRHPDLPEPSPFHGPALPIRLSRAELGSEPANVLGASTEPVLRELLGVGDDEMERLWIDGALGPRDPD